MYGGLCDALCRAVLCRAVPCRAVPCRAVPCRAVPCLRHARLLLTSASFVDGDAAQKLETPKLVITVAGMAQRPGTFLKKAFRVKEQKSKPKTRSRHT
jgi:hypothetical protein